MDFGKFVYERAKKEREARKSQTKIEVKEIRLRPKTNEAHRGFKVDDARRWLLQGHKVRVTIKFRGREMDYPEIALEDLKEIAESLADAKAARKRRKRASNRKVARSPRLRSKRKPNKSKSQRCRRVRGSLRKSSPAVYIV
jgi:translation initiation factor IF-3